MSQDKKVGYRNKAPYNLYHSRTNKSIKVEICMVSTCLSLSIISTGIIGIIAKSSTIMIPLIFKFLINIIAIISAYAALWTFACACKDSDQYLGSSINARQNELRRTSSFYGLSEIYSMLTKPDIYGPYWIITWALLLWLFVSCSLIGELI